MSLRSSLTPTPLANRWPQLHGLRVFAILSVLQVHVSVLLAQQGLLANKTLYLVSVMVWFGMDMFFLQSGFLIGSILLDDQRRGGLGRFYLRRAFRTFPPYYVVLAVLAIVWRKHGEHGALLLREVFYATNYLERWNDVNMPWAWSLCVEEHFYLAVPIVILAVRVAKTHRARLWWLAGLFALGFLVRVGHYATARHPWTDELMFERIFIRTHDRLDVLIAGIALSYVQRHHQPELRAFFARARNRVLSWLVVVAGFSFLMLPPSLRPGHAWALLSWGTVTSITYGVLVLMLLNHAGPASRFFGARAFLWTATLGYSVYLVHIPLCDALVAPVARVLVRAKQWPMAAVWPASVALLFAASLAVSYLLHLLVEKPAMWLRARVAP